MTPLEVAQWMRDKVLSENYMYQEDIVYEIAQKFGEEYVYDNENGNLAISKKVLKEFRRLTEETVVWERGERCWRKREPSDDPDRRQAD
jgi:hypothetical protein